MATITYWRHSGFSVRTQRRLFLFDYIGGGMPDPRPEDRAIALVSHKHSDHYEAERIAAWRAAGLAKIVVGKDLHKSVGDLRMRDLDASEIDGVSIKAFGSTDAGNSFWLEVDGLRVFHAGDFNLWHWRAESTAGEVRDAEHRFDAILATITGNPVDVAFFPVDPRMGEGHDEGAMRFAEAIRPALIIPMHWWDRPEVAEAFAQKQMPGGVRAKALTQPGQSVEYACGSHYG